MIGEGVGLLITCISLPSTFYFMLTENLYFFVWDKMTIFLYV